MFRLASSVLPEKALQGLTATYFRANAWLKLGTGKFHSEQQLVNCQNMDITILPALSDNYMYLLVDKATNTAAIIDPVDPPTVCKAVEEAGVNLTTVLTTHHHWDHAGGNENLVKAHKSPLQVYGGDDRIGALTKKVTHGDKIILGNINIECLFTPCHTTGHFCFYVTVPGDTTQNPVVFTGDTLFLAGCGKFFEGDAVQMHRSLIEVLGSLPDETQVYCGHEYATSNLQFAMFMEPNNEDTKAKYEAIVKRRKENQPSVPSSIGEEKRINPYMRANEESMQKRVGKLDPVDVIRAVREIKDKWTPPKA